MAHNVRLERERVGLTKQNKYNESMTIIAYRGSKNMDVQFENGEIITTTWQQWLSGGIRNAYSPTVWARGYIGKGPYTRKDTLLYHKWTHMLERVFSSKFHQHSPQYKGCQVSPEWLNFQNFCHDILQMCPNFYNSKCQYELDKDLLYKGNKIYGPDTCCLIPGELNTILTQSNASRGQYPVGVYYDNGGTKHDHPGFRIAISKLESKHKSGKRFKTPEDAFAYYKQLKEAYVKERAVFWKPYLSTKAFNALMNWEVNIDD